MFKLVCASVLTLLVLLQLQQPVRGYKIITYNYQALPVSSSVTSIASTPVVPVQDIQTVKNSIVTSKANLLTTLFNTILQLKQNIVQAYANSLNSIQPVVFTKTIQPVVYTKTIQPVVYTKTIQPAYFTKTVNFGYGVAAAPAASRT